MSDLSEYVKANKNITQIAIPGSHDCGTYSLDKSLPVGPDEADILQSLGNQKLYNALYHKQSRRYSRGEGVLPSFIFPGENKTDTEIENL